MRGPSRDTRTGLLFEKRSDWADRLAEIPGYTITTEAGKEGFFVCWKDKRVARVVRQYGFYRWLDEMGVPWRGLIARKIVPDDAILVLDSSTLFIIEAKYQQRGGSVDEKLQTFQFKLWFFRKLLKQTAFRVEYGYVLEQKWFSNKNYRDMLDYIESAGSFWYFNVLPFTKLGLPDPSLQDG